MRISVIGSGAFEIGHALRDPGRANENILATDLALLRADGYYIPKLVHRSFIRIYANIHVEPVPTIEVLSRGLGRFYSGDHSERTRSAPCLQFY